MLIKPILKTAFAFFFMITLIGCASHSNRMEDATTLMKHGEYKAAEELAAAALEGERNQLLRLMEVGVLKHLQGSYSESNQLLSQADRLAYELYTTSVSDLMARVGTNATLVTYRSNIYERVYIHYYKTLNYLYLAEEAKNSSEFQKHLDAARIEGRRAQILLDENLFKEGSYEEAEEENQKLLTQMLDLFAALNGEVINPRELIFRDNAFTHYLIGTLYERYDELDNARVSYERSARTYENGYIKQYGLDPGMASQAWFDTARILKTQRENRWQRIAQEKLTSQQQDTLQNWNPRQQAQLLVIQEVGMMSPRGELNLWMRLNTHTNQLVISPVLTGDESQKAYQLAWFHYLYADKGLLDVIERIAVDDYIGLIGGSHEKTMPLGPLRNNLDSLGLTEILASTGVRLTVPMFYYFEPEIKRTRLQLQPGKEVNLLNADNLAGLAMAQHLVDAQSEMNQAMAIESLRLVLCVQTGIPAPMCSLTAAATTSADTRLWVTLPNRIRLTRHLLEPGEYTLELISEANNFDVREQQTLNLEAGDLHIWRTRHFAENPTDNLPTLVQEARAARMANETLVDKQAEIKEKIEE